jgi:hypothetical protein
MSATIFFSWQADTPTKEGRNFIERALERAARKIGDDATVEEAARDLKIDRDTKDSPGSPPIVETIFRKIDKAAIFAPDLTFVGRRLDGRPTPNPNVLVEYGWALKSLGHSRILPIMNTAYGAPTAENMPFDMVHLRRPILYDCPADADGERRSRERETLSKELERRVGEIIRSDEFRSSLPKAQPAPPFAPQDSKDGAARFRASGAPLGINNRSWGTSPQEIMLRDGPAMWLRVMPEINPRRKWTVTEVSRVATEAVAMPLCRPVGGYGHVRAHDGFGVYQSDGPQSITGNAVFIFITGEVWAVQTWDLEAASHANAIPFVEKEFKDGLKAYGDLLRRLGVTSHLAWIAGMEGIKGRGLYIPDRPGYSSAYPGARGKCLVDPVIEEGRYSVGDDPGLSVRPFFVKLFESCALERPAWLDTLK